MLSNKRQANLTNLFSPIFFFLISYTQKWKFIQHYITAQKLCQIHQDLVLGVCKYSNVSISIRSLSYQIEIYWISSLFNMNQYRIKSLQMTIILK